MNREQWLAGLDPVTRQQIEAAGARFKQQALLMKRKLKAQGLAAEQRRAHLRNLVFKMIDSMSADGMDHQHISVALAQWGITDSKGAIMPEFGGHPKKPRGR